MIGLPFFLSSVLGLAGLGLAGLWGLARGHRRRVGEIRRELDRAREKLGRVPCYVDTGDPIMPADPIWTVDGAYVRKSWQGGIDAEFARKHKCRYYSSQAAAEKAAAGEESA